MKTENRRILIIDDERPILITLEALLERHGYQVDTAPTAAQGLKLLKSKSPALVLLDLQLPDAEGLEMLDRIKTELPDMQVIILTAHDSLHNAIESIKRGAYHFISKPYASEELLSLVENALEKQFLVREAEKLREKTEQLEKRLEMAETRATPVFKSKPMQQVDELINAMGPSDANVLIVGESGVAEGREQRSMTWLRIHGVAQGARPSGDCAGAVTARREPFRRSLESLCGACSPNEPDASCTSRVTAGRHAAQPTPLTTQVSCQGRIRGWRRRTRACSGRRRACCGMQARRVRACSSISCFQRETVQRLLSKTNYFGTGRRSDKRNLNGNVELLVVALDRLRAVLCSKLLDNVAHTAADHVCLESGGHRGQVVLQVLKTQAVWPVVVR